MRILAGMALFLTGGCAAAVVAVFARPGAAHATAAGVGLWAVYDQSLSRARYRLSTDQFGTQLDPPAHWAPSYPAIDELPPTYGVRPLVVISIVPQVKQDPKYALDTDTTPTLEGESWLMHHGFTQAEGVANLDGVPATGCLVAIGYPKFKGGVGGYARYVAICPQSTAKGVTISSRDAPLPRSGRVLHWDAKQGYRVR
jgi:hypothetical protein